MEVVAVASRDRARAETYASEHGIPRAHGSYEALLSDPEVDAVYVSLPNSLHMDWSIRALLNGKHVLCEKPLDRRVAPVERAFDVAAQQKLILMEGFMYRHHLQTHMLESVIANGSIGQLRHIRAAFCFLLEDPDNVRLQADLDGGALMDLGCYCVNGLRLLAGEPELVFARQVVGETGVDLRLSALLQFPDGVIAQFHCAFDLAYESRLEALGSHGSVLVREPWLARDPHLELRRGDVLQRIDVEDADRYQLQLENFAAAIRGEAKPLLGRDDAVAQARVIEALYRSAGTGEAVAL